MTKDRHQLQQSRPRPSPELRVVRISLTPTNWVGKLLGALAAIALIAVALMVSLMAFVLVGAVFAAALLAFLWQAQDRTQSPRSYDAEVERVEDHMEQR